MEKVLLIDYCHAYIERLERQKEKENHYGSGCTQLYIPAKPSNKCCICLFPDPGAFIECPDILPSGGYCKSRANIDCVAF